MEAPMSVQDIISTYLLGSVLFLIAGYIIKNW